MARNWRKGITLLSLFCVGLAVLIVLLRFAVRPEPKRKPTVTILDQRLQVFSAETVRGSNTYYLSADGSHLGNRLEGKIKSRLRAWGLPMDVPPKFTPGTGSTAQAFIICYNFPLPAVPTAHLDAELVAEDGTFVPLHSNAGGGGGPPQRYWNLWTLDSLPSNRGDCVLRLKLQTNGTPVGEIRFSQK